LLIIEIFVVCIFVLLLVFLVEFLLSEHFVIESDNIGLECAHLIFEVVFCIIGLFLSQFQLLAEEQETIFVLGDQFFYLLFVLHDDFLGLLVVLVSLFGMSVSSGILLFLSSLLVVDGTHLFEMNSHLLCPVLAQVLSHFCSLPNFFRFLLAYFPFVRLCLLFLYH
jgi:hypothetical protein